MDIQKIRKDFPILAQKVHGKPLAYLDNAATTQKPQAVIDALVRYYSETNANIHRGVHLLSEKATAEYEAARGTVKDFIHASHAHEIIFTRGTTESINLVAATLGRQLLKAGDEVLITALEHHSNIVPWQILCQEKGAILKVAPITDAGELIVDEFLKRLTPKTRIVSIVHVSNALGTVNPVKPLVKAAHEAGAVVLVDGAQAVAHIPVDVRALDCDFYAFSAHKLYGPTGVGVLYGKEKILNGMPPYQGGGDMIREVTFEKSTYNDLPYKFEAGTPDISGVIGLAAAIRYLNQWDAEEIFSYEKELVAYATERLKSIGGVQLVGTASEKVSVVSFVMDVAHPHDIGTILDQEGVAIRTGHHCAMPLMERLNVPATARASFAMYNTRGEVDALASGIEKVRKVFG